MSELILVCFTKPENGGVPYKGVYDAIRADEARSGCRVTMIADNPLPCKNFVPFEECCTSVNKLMEKLPPEKRTDWAMLGIKRNLIVYDFVKSRGDISWPIFPLDNDILVFSDLTKVYSYFDGCDFTSPIYGNSEMYGTSSTAGAYSIHNKEVLEAAVEKIYQLLETEKLVTDMVLWSRMYQSGKWKVGNILDKVDGLGAFDSNIHMKEDRYVMEPSTVPSWGPETKKIVWENKQPHFVEESDGSLVPAHWIHCWGSYKFRTQELVWAAGV